MLRNFAVAQHLAVGDAIERHAAGKTEILHAGLGGEAARQPQHDLLQHRLDRGGEVHVLLRHQRFRIARRRAEQRVEALVRHRQPGAVIEIVEIEAERSVRLEIDQIVANLLHVARLAIGREPHQLVFAGIDLEAGVVGECGIEQAEAVREMDFLVNGEVVAFADRHGGGRPFADAVEREHRGAIERRRVERRSGVAQMMLAEQ